MCEIWEYNIWFYLSVECRRRRPPFGPLRWTCVPLWKVSVVLLPFLFSFLTEQLINLNHKKTENIYLEKKNSSWEKFNYYWYPITGHMLPPGPEVWYGSFSAMSLNLKYLYIYVEFKIILKRFFFLNCLDAAWYMNLHLRTTVQGSNSNPTTGMYPILPMYRAAQH